MSVHAVLNLLNELRKRDHIFIVVVFFLNKFNRFKNIGARC